MMEGRLSRMGLWVVLAMLGVGGWPIIPGEALAAEKVIFQFDWVPYGKYVGYYAAKEKGFYKAVEVDVTFERGFGTSSSSVAAGKVDYGIDGVGSVVIARHEKLPVKLIAMWHERGMYSVFALKSSGILTPKDLEGRNLGVTMGDALHRNFPIFAEAVGLKKWNWVPLRPEMKNPSLLAKKVDAMIGYTIQGIPVRLQAKNIGEEVVEFLWSDFGVRLPTDGLVAHDKTLAERPDQVRRFLLATLKGQAWAIENPKEAVDIFQRVLPDASRSMTEAFWDLSSRFQVWGSLKEHGLGYIDRGVMEYTRNAIAKGYELKEPPALEEIYTTGFLPKELPRPKLPGA